MKCHCDCHLTTEIIKELKLKTCDMLTQLELDEILQNDAKRRELNVLIDQKHHLQTIREYTNSARDGTEFNTPMMDIIIAVEQLWLVEKRRLNKKLREKGIREMKR